MHIHHFGNYPHIRVHVSSPANASVPNDQSHIYNFLNVFIYIGKYPYTRPCFYPCSSPCFGLKVIALFKIAIYADTVTRKASVYGTLSVSSTIG